MKNITIVGGGACGTAVFIELLLQIVTSGLANQLKITIIEKDKRLGYGLAFGTEQPGHLLNTQTELMGIHVHEPQHFSQWLMDQGGKNREDVKGGGETDHTYTTRKLYGDYVSSQAKEYLQRAKKAGLETDIIYAEAIDIHRVSGSYEVLCHDGRRIVSEFVVLALGTPEPNNYNEFSDLPEFVGFPWPSARIIHAVGHNDHVGILGTSLSAIDAVMTLVDNGHRGEISLFSPDGMLPRVQPEDTSPYERRMLTLSKMHEIKRKTMRKVGVKQVFRLFQQEVEAHAGQPIDWKSKKREKRAAEPMLEEDIAMAERGGDALSDVIYSLRYDAGKIWKMWDEEEKDRFKKWLGSHWIVYRHAMPLHNAYRLRELFRQKRLHIYPGLEAVEFNPRQRTFHLELEASTSKTVDKLINATGIPSHLSEMGCTLVDNLLQKKYLTPYSVGGACINELTMQAISPKGGEGIYVLGHLANGILLDVNAVWFNVRTAAILCEHLLSQIGNGRVF